MTISVLTENYAGSNTFAEHGLSYLIEHDGKKILFDAGQSDVFIKNARLMGINPLKPDIIVLSHGHFDHGNGLGCLENGVLLCHPGCFVKRYRKADHNYIGLKYTKEDVIKKFELITAETPYKISERILFLGEIPRITPFESKNSSFIFDDGTSDFVSDDSAVAFLLPQGLFIITGCGHSGIVNTIEHAKKITGEDRIYGIMGGFHLKQVNWQTHETISYLIKNKVEHVYPSHCTALPALSTFYESFKSRQVKTGDVLVF